VILTDPPYNVGFNRFNSAGGIPRTEMNKWIENPCVSIASTARGVFQDQSSDTLTLVVGISFNRFNSAGGIPSVEYFGETQIVSMVSIASTARGVFQAAGLYRTAAAARLCFNRFNSAGGIPSIAFIGSTAVMFEFQSLQQRGGYSKHCRRAAGRHAGGSFQSLQQRGGYSKFVNPCG